MKLRSWPDPPDVPAEEVHLWWARIDSERSEGSEFLSEDERARSARFVHDVHRVRFDGRRRLLRVLLGAYLERDPATLDFVLGPHGKPALADRRLGEWSFNLSHSDDVVVIAVARSPANAPRALGVDVEAQRLETELERVAVQVFTVRERAELARIEPPEARESAFFRGWTRKEAGLKALGEGFAREPRTLDVGLEPADFGQLWQVDSEPTLESFAFADLAAPEGFAACVCAAGSDWTPRVVVAI